MLSMHTSILEMLLVLLFFRPDTLFTAGYDYPCTRDYTYDHLNKHIHKICEDAEHAHFNNRDAARSAVVSAQTRFSPQATITPAHATTCTIIKTNTYTHM